MEISNPSCVRNSSLSDGRCQGVKLNAFSNRACQANSGVDPENSETGGRVPHPTTPPPLSPRMKTSLQPDCIIITTLEGQFEGLGSCIQKRGAAAPTNPPLIPPMAMSRVKQARKHIKNARYSLKKLHTPITGAPKDSGP